MQHEELMPDDGWQLPPQRRIAPVTESNPGLIKKLFLIGIERIGKLNAANLWTLMMHNMRIFHGMLFYAARLMPYGRLERRDGNTSFRGKLPAVIRHQFVMLHTDSL